MVFKNEYAHIQKQVYTFLCWLIIVLFLSGFTTISDLEKSRENDTEIPTSFDTEHERKPANKHYDDEKKLYSYKDSLKIYLYPCDTSIVIGYMNFLEPYDRLYRYERNYYKKYPEIYAWHGIIYNEDTCWIKRESGLSTTKDIEILGDLILYHHYDFVEVCGDDCYSFTNVYHNDSIIDYDSPIIQKRLERSLNRQLNDSIYLFSNDHNWLILFNSRTNKILHDVSGGSINISENDNLIYYLTFEKFLDINKYGLRTTDTPCRLHLYNYNSFKEKVLFQENNIQRKPYICGPDHCDMSKIRIEKSDSTLMVVIRLFRLKPKPMDEGDVYCYEYIVDTSGKTYSSEVYLKAGINSKGIMVENDSIKNFILNY